jgi:hypothetical protein
MAAFTKNWRRNGAICRNVTAIEYQKPYRCGESGPPLSFDRHGESRDTQIPTYAPALLPGLFPCRRGHANETRPLPVRAGFSFWRVTRRRLFHRVSSARNTIETVFAFDETIFRLPLLNPASQRVTNGRRVAEKERQ